MHTHGSRGRPAARSSPAVRCHGRTLALIALLVAGVWGNRPAARAEESFFWSDTLPPLDGKVGGGTGVVVYAAAGASVQSVSLGSFSATFAPPPLGSNVQQSFSAMVELELSLDVGATFTNASAPASVTVRLHHTNDFRTTRRFEAELMQLDIAGGTLPAGVMIRESPTLVSPGFTTVRGASGGYRIESVLDAQTEISLDGGGTWTPASNPLTLALTTVAPPPFIAPGAVWKYWDDGSDLSSFWHSPAYPDEDWASGPAQLGYGDGDESTINSFGPNANDKHITTYYRHTFVLADPSAYTNLLLRLLRDDGGIVYLNDVEVFRSNMPTGAVNHLTLAAAAAATADETTNFHQKAVNPALLVPGTNLVAVEIHQNTNTSSDISFDLALLGNFVPVPPTVSITSPTNGAVREVWNLTIFATASDSDGDVTGVAFYADANRLGEVNAAPYVFTWLNVPAGVYTLTAVATDSSGLAATSAPVTVTIVTPPPTFIPRGAVWKYLDDGSDQGTAWRAPEFADGGWTDGPAELGYGEGDEATVINGGPTTNRILTTYFRHTFEVANPAAHSNLIVRVLRDDGAIVYLNGVEVFRSNMPTGAVAYLTQAAQVVGNATTFYATNVPLALVLAGTNVLAVEIHQVNNTSSDVSFDLELLPDVVPVPPEVSITSPTNGASLPGPTNVTIAVTATDFDGPVAQVEFFVDGDRVGMDRTEAYSLVVPNLAIGTHSLVAVATDHSGLAATSAPVELTIIGVPVVTTLIATGSVWKYRDDGSNQGTNWVAPDFDDSGWSNGLAKFGYGDPFVTLIRSNNASNQRIITHYFRHRFPVADATAVTNLTFRVLRDDGVVVHLNGRDLFRMNMGSGLVTNLTPASTAVGGTAETTYFPTNLAPTELVTGTNVLAVELHQSGPGTTDAGFDLELTSIGPPLVRPPRPTLSIELTESEVRITWSGSGFVLQEADDPAGPFRDVTPLVNSSPYVVPSPTNSLFFGLRLGP